MAISRIASSLAMAIALLAVATPADATIYRGTRYLGGPLTATLEVTTDGTLGVLGAANIVYFKVTFSGLYEEDIPNYGQHPTIQTNAVTLDGTSLWATQGKLLFDFDTGNGFFGVIGPSYLFTSADCGCFFSSVEYYRLDPEFSNWFPRSGVEVLGIVPEPSSWAMLIAGFGMTGVMMRRRARLAA